MDRVRTISFASLAVLAVACGSGPEPTMEDAAIVIPDVGPPDAGQDSGPPDGGDGTCADRSMLPLGTPPLADECLPRCSSATRDAVAACADASCIASAQSADTTPPATLRTMYGIVTISCGGGVGAYPCSVWQGFSCSEEFCRTEYYAYADCASMGGACTAEQDAVTACIDANPEATACMRDRIAACFPPAT